MSKEKLLISNSPLEYIKQSSEVDLAQFLSENAPTLVEERKLSAMFGADFANLDHLIDKNDIESARDRKKQEIEWLNKLVPDTYVEEIYNYRWTGANFRKLNPYNWNKSEAQIKETIKTEIKNNVVNNIIDNVAREIINRERKKDEQLQDFEFVAQESYLAPLMKILIQSYAATQNIGNLQSGNSVGNVNHNLVSHKQSTPNVPHFVPDSSQDFSRQSSTSINMEQVHKNHDQNEPKVLSIPGHQNFKEKFKTAFKSSNDPKIRQSAIKEQIRLHIGDEAEIPEKDLDNIANNYISKHTELEETRSFSTSSRKSSIEKSPDKEALQTHNTRFKTRGQYERSLTGEEINPLTLESIKDINPLLNTRDFNKNGVREITYGLDHARWSEDSNTTKLSETARSFTREMMNNIEKNVNVKFTEVPSNIQPELSFYEADLEGSVVGHYVNDENPIDFIAIDTGAVLQEDISRSSGKKGNLKYILLHEIGHALGLSHPYFQSLAEKFGLPSHLSDQTSDNTLMSYFTGDHTIRSEIEDLQWEDIAALQEMYGVAPGVNPMRLILDGTKKVMTYFGVNELDASSFSSASIIHLDSGTGKITVIGDQRAWLAPNNNALIARASKGGSEIHENKMDNELYGGDGKDKFFMKTGYTDNNVISKFDLTQDQIIFSTQNSTDPLVNLPDGVRILNIPIKETDNNFQFGIKQDGNNTQLLIPTHKGIKNITLANVKEGEITEEIFNSDLFNAVMDKIEERSDIAHYDPFVIFGKPYDIPHNSSNPSYNSSNPSYNSSNPSDRDRPSYEYEDKDTVFRKTVEIVGISLMVFLSCVASMYGGALAADAIKKCKKSNQEEFTENEATDAKNSQQVELEEIIVQGNEETPTTSPQQTVLQTNPLLINTDSKER